MKCPTCKEVHLTMSERNGIEIDYCPECRGVWLDRGELDKLIEKSNHQPSQSHAHSKHQDQRSHYKEHKRKSFLSELFD